MLPVRPRRRPLMVALLAVAAVAVAGAAVGAGAPWGYLLPAQHGLYAPGGGHSSFGSLSINNTTVTLGQNGSWYSVGFFSNISVVVYLNVSGGQGQLTVDNLSGSEFNALASNQSFIPNNRWTGVNATSIRQNMALVASTDYWVFLNTGAASIVITFNLDVV